ncbi:MAG: TonB-dependent receptor [Rhodospirillaceae bacterium]|nr:TonB-dependent receptor [Rhodospirillaceae bacterium]
MSQRSLFFSSVSSRAILPALCLFALSAHDARAEDASALDPIVVTATRLPTPASQLASSVTVITAEEIETKQWRTLPEALREVPGLNVVQTGGPGGQTSLFMRGTNSNHTKVLLDGIDIADPSTPSGGADLFQFLTADIERIEVLRGPQSGLYGSDAVGGVVNIITKRGQGPFKMTGMAEGGSFGTFNQAASAQGETGRVNYALNVAHDRSTSVRVTPDALLAPGQPRQDDRSDNVTVSTRLGAELAENLEASLVARATKTQLNSDTIYGTERDDLENRDYFTRGAIHQTLFDGRFDHEFGVAYSHYRRRASYAGDVPSFFNGERAKTDWQGNIHLTPGQILTLGGEFQREGIDTSDSSTGGVNDVDKHVDTKAGFVQLQSNWNERVVNALSLRYDDHGTFGGRATYRVAPALLIPETGTKLKTSLGTGFKAPSLDQLYHNYYFPASWGYGPYYTYGNPDLKPERSLGYDAGFEQKIYGVSFGATYFHNKIKNMIDTATTYVGSASYTDYINVGRAKTQGVETFIAFDPWKDLNLKGTYTYTLAEDEGTNLELLRRPKHKGSLSATWKATEKLSLTSSLIASGGWVDKDRKTSARVQDGGYATVNLAASYDMTDSLTAFGRVTNLLDRKVENPDGYLQPGAGVFAGIRARF